MFTCEECYAVCEGQEKHPQAAACDEFDGQEEEAVVDPVSVEIRNLYGMVAILNCSLTELERKFDTVIAAVVKAAGQEEER